MPTQYRPERRTIGELLSMTNPPILVPNWQRNFSWTTSEVETFWQDLMLFNEQYPGETINIEEYFLGSVVIVDNNEFHLLLDGQQRLATSAILISVIRDFLAKYRYDAAVRTSNRYLTDFDDARGTNTYKLTLNRYDRDFFKREILEQRDTSYSPADPVFESHRLIRKAREFFVTQFQKKFDEIADPAESHQWALRIQRVLTSHMSVVAVVSDDEDNAATVFETLNDRGIGLSTPDLLRNLLLRRAREEDREEIIDLWGEILEIEGDVNLKTFLRHYWLSHEGDVKTQSLYREIKNNITTTNIDSLIFSRELRDASVIYRDILSSIDDSEEISSILRDINELDANLLFPVILSAYQSGGREYLHRFLNSLLVTYVRHTVIGGLENSRLENIIFALAKKIRKGGNLLEAISELRSFAPDDTTFKDTFERTTVSRRQNARYILRQLERFMRTTGELEIASPSKVHVEHIYPQTPQPEYRWGNHTHAINRLGNLTLLDRSLNTSIKNGQFSVKKTSYEQSEILLTKALLIYDNWDFSTVETRQKAMSEKVAEIWAFPS